MVTSISSQILSANSDQNTANNNCANLNNNNNNNNFTSKFENLQPNNINSATNNLYESNATAFQSICTLDKRGGVMLSTDRLI